MKTLIGLLLGLAATAAWGSFYVAGRWLFGEEGDKLNTYLFNFLRFFMATLSLSGLLLIKSNREKFKQAIREDWKSFLLISLIGIVMESYLVFYALKFTTASRCSLMANFSPVATVILAYFLLGEKINKAGVIGMLTGFAGIILAGSSRGGDIYAGTSLRTLIGDGMALASGFCWAYFTVSGVKVSDKYEGQAVFLKIDIDEEDCEPAAIKYGITSIPNIIAFKDGKPVDNSLGFVPQAVLESFIERNL